MNLFEIDCSAVYIAYGLDLIDFLTEREIKFVNREGEFRRNLYSMFLSTQFSEAIQNKSAFVQHSLTYTFNS